MSWLGASGFSRDAMQSLGAAYASVGQPQQQTAEESFEKWLDEQLEGGADLSEFTTDEVYDYYVNEVLEEGKKEEVKSEPQQVVVHKQQQDIYSALQDAYSMMYEKKKDSDKCGEGTYWDKEDKKCKKKKSSKTTVVVGRGGYYGGGLHGHGGGGGSNGGGDTDPDGGDGGDGGGGDGGGGE